VASDAFHPNLLAAAAQDRRDRQGQVQDGQRQDDLGVGSFEFAVINAITVLGPKAFAAEITRHLTKYLNRRVALAQVFLSLERLEDKGLLSSRETQPEPVRGGRRRRVFRLEASGARAFRTTAATMQASLTETSYVEGSRKREPSPA